MTKELRNDLMQAVQEDRLYSYVAENYWKLDKEDLKNILLEVIYSPDNKETLLYELEQIFPAEDYEDEE